IREGGEHPGLGEEREGRRFRHVPSCAQRPAQGGREKNVQEKRSKYAASRVSTLMIVPASRNCGTCTTRPVSSFAGLYDAEAVAPFIPGSTSTIRRFTVVGSSTETGLSS